VKQKNGKIITLWSNSKKSGKSVFLLNLAKNISAKLEEDTADILIVDLNSIYGNLLELASIEKDQIYANIESFIDKDVLESIDPKKILPKKDGVYFLGSKIFYHKYEFVEKFEAIFEMLQQHFDLIIVDLISSSNNPISNAILKNANYNVNLLLQDIGVIEGKFSKENDTFYVVNQYDDDIYPSIADVSRISGIKKEKFYTLPYSKNLKDSLNRRDLKIFERNNEDADTLSYKAEISRISDDLINLINSSHTSKQDIRDYALRLKPVKEEKKTLMNKIKNYLLKG
jgi:hypothetical protein